MHNHAQIKDIVQHILRKFRWIEEGSWFDVSSITRQEHVNPEKWVSIGIFEPNEDESECNYTPLWDIYTTNLEITKGRLRYACLRIGGLFAEKYKIES